MTEEFCTECCDVIKSDEQRKACLDYNHSFIRVRTEEEIRKAKADYEKNDRFTFDSFRNGNKIIQQIQDYKITTLRPIFYRPDNGKRMILVYLPTKLQIEKGKDDNVSVTTDFQNRAYFVVQNPKQTVRLRREILPFDNEYFKDKYKINVLETWNDVRWEISDLKKWLIGTTFTDPKLVFEIHSKTVKKYLEYAGEAEYVKFSLWNIGTYFFELFDVYPYNDFTGTKRAGKSKSLEFQKLVCYNSVMSPDITSSAIFRIIEGLGATILLDETEQFRNQKNDKAQNVRTLLVQGFLKNQYAIRSQTKDNGNFTPTEFNIYSPKSLAHINSLDDVLEDRCIQNVNRRALDPKIKNSWPTENDLAFQKIRNLCYRLYLDFGDEIFKLKSEVESLLAISGRELQLWTPVMTLALFFEKHGISGLINLVKEIVKQSSHDRQMYDEEESRDLRVLQYLDELAVSFAQNKEMIKKNPLGWIPHSVLYKELDLRQDQYDINTNYFTKKTLSETLVRLGLKKQRKESGYSWLVTRSIIEEIKQRMDFGQLEKQKGHDITSFGSEGSGSSVQEQNFTNKTEQTEQNVLPEQYSKVTAQAETTSEKLNFSEKSEQIKSSGGSEVQEGDK